MEKLSSRVAHLSESQTIAMARRSRELKEQGIDVISLSLGEPDFNTPDVVKQAAKKAIDDNFSFYTHVSGYLELRQAISRKFKRDNDLDYSAEQIVVSTGAKQSIANAMLSLVNPGDEVLVPSPYWVSYLDIIRLAEGKIVPVDASLENDFKITGEQLKKAITPKSRVIIFSSPCNPTGSVYSLKELEELANVIAGYPNLYIIADEIYEHINFIGKTPSMGTIASVKDRVITINGLSKAFAMTGWRVGYLGAPTEIAKACDKIQGQITSATCSIAQKAAEAAVNMDPATTIPMRESFKKRRDLVIKLMKDIPGLKCNVPDGAFYVFPDVTYYFGKSYEGTLMKNASDLCAFLLDHAQVAIVPGVAFGNDDHVRISYATSEAQLTKAFTRIKESLSQLK